MALSKEDLKAIKQLVRQEIDQALEQKLEEKLEAKLEEKLEAKLEEKLDEKLRLFPTRQEFFSHMDEIMTELKAIRQEQEFQTYRLRDHEDRIQTLEDAHPEIKRPTQL